MSLGPFFLYNFFRRYKWTEDDFNGWQSGMIGSARAMFQGLLGAGVMQGFDLTLNGNLTVSVAAGLASGPDGYLHFTNASQDIAIPAPGANQARHLLVLRPSIVDDTPITRPTTPFDTVFLRENQTTQLVVIQGTAASSPVYPAALSTDVVLCGIRVANGQTVLSTNDLDFEVRDIPGKNSNFQQDSAKYDDRLRPYRSSNTTLGIKPSQLQAPFAKVFSYTNKSRPSIFPKDLSGNYNPADTFLNFQSGAITGGDLVTADFVPTIPTAGNAINATVAVNTDDTLSVTYGTQGTRAQCASGILNQAAAGAGSVAVTANTKPVAFVTLYSADGANITELDFVDCRGVSGIGEFSPGVSAGGARQPASGEYPVTLTSSDDGKVVEVDTSAARTINLPAAPTAGFKVTFKDITGLAGTNSITIGRNGKNIEGLASDLALEANWGSWTFFYDGTEYILI